MNRNDGQTTAPLTPRRLELPVVNRRRAELDTCAYCPRLCRAVCPVSNAQPREALIPWGKMVSLLSTEPAAIREEPWGCTGCGACTEFCRHDNPVAEVLIEGRASVFAADRAPAAAVRIAQEHPGRVLRQSSRIEELSQLVATDPEAPTALLLGCAALRGAPALAETTVRVAAQLVDEPIRLLSDCCGLIPALAGDAAAARLSEERLVRSLRGVERLIVADPGCNQAVDRMLVERRSVARRVESHPFFAWVAGQSSALRSVARPGVRYGWQPPCWARGTSAEPAARVLLTALLGDFVEVGRGCSGGGGLVPSVFPEASERIAQSRLREFREAEVDCLVVGCASGARRLRTSSKDDGGPEIVELSALLWEGVRDP